MDKNKDAKYAKYLDTIAKGVYNLAMREGPLVDFHAEKKIRGDKEMEIINRFAFNRIGYLFNLLFNGEKEKFERICITAAMPLSYFAPLDFESEEVKSIETIWQLLNDNN